MWLRWEIKALKGIRSSEVLAGEGGMCSPVPWGEEKGSVLPASFGLDFGNAFFPKTALAQLPRSPDP